MHVEKVQYKIHSLHVLDIVILIESQEESYIVRHSENKICTINKY